MNTIQEGWETYQKDVIPKNAGEVQRIETRRSFYGGAYWALQVMTSIDENISDEAGAMILEGLLQECRAFGRRGGV